jgi:hypothetical protein
MGAREGLLPPGALALVQPAWGPAPDPGLEALARLPAEALALAIVGEEDAHVPAEQPRAIFAGLGAIAAANRNFVTVRSDAHGAPSLRADHSAPLAELAEIGPPLSGATLEARAQAMTRMGLRTKAPGALDFYGHWKLVDALAAAVATGRHRDVALGDTPAQRFMGHWSDGVPVRELLVRTA